MKFGEALELLKSNRVVRLPDGSTYCLCTSEDVIGITVPEIRQLSDVLSMQPDPLIFKSDPVHKIVQFGWLPTIKDLLREDWEVQALE